LKGKQVRERKKRGREEKECKEGDGAVKLPSSKLDWGMTQVAKT
jgi:hypothetical protein